MKLIFKCPYCGSRDSYDEADMSRISAPPCYVCGQELLRFERYAEATPEELEEST